MAKKIKVKEFSIDDLGGNRSKKEMKTPVEKVEKKEEEVIREFEIDTSDVKEVSFYRVYNKKVGRPHVFMFLTIGKDVYYLNFRSTKSLLKTFGIYIRKLRYKPVVQRNKFILHRINSNSGKLKLYISKDLKDREYVARVEYVKK